MSSRVVVFVITVALTSSSSRGAVAQERLVAQPSTAGVHDGAGMFSEAAVRDAGETLRKVSDGSGVVAIVETIDSLSGESVEEAAVRRARRLDDRGIFVLVARKDMKLEVLGARLLHEAFPRETLHAIRTAFSDEFRKKDFDAGLRAGAAAISAAVATARAEGKLPKHDPTAAESPASSDRPASPLVARDQIKLTLEGARVVVEAAQRKASAMGLKSNIAVVDDGGHLLTFDRMTGARPASGYTAITKAVSAATFRQASGPIPPGAAEPSPILNIGLENAAAASGGRITALKGGVPIVVDGQVIGGVGAGGGTGEQDAEVVQAGIDALLRQLASPKPTNAAAAVKD